jgi:Gas vesicle synthesis protein GvpO
MRGDEVVMADNRSSEGDERLSARDLTREAKRTVEELIGCAPEAVTGFQWDGDAWLVSVDVCELERVPNTTDVMATYVVQLDDRGGLIGYKRDRRFQRGHGDEG